MNSSIKNASYRYTVSWVYSIAPFFIVFIIPSIAFFLPIGAWYFLDNSEGMTLNAWLGVIFASFIGYIAGHLPGSGLVVTPKYVEIRKFIFVWRIRNEDIKSVEVASGAKPLRMKAPVSVRVRTSSGAVYHYASGAHGKVEKRMLWAENIKKHLPEGSVIISPDIVQDGPIKNRAMAAYRRLRSPNLISILAALWAVALYVVPKI